MPAATKRWNKLYRLKTISKEFTDEKCFVNDNKCILNKKFYTVSGGLQDKVEIIIIPCKTPEYCGAISCDKK